MIGLPRHLAPWAPHLALFPEEIALALGPIVIQISHLIGGAKINRDLGGAPDGYDGIARRGSYDRLLASEWLVHEELPDEFLRRVVSGEHSFLQRSYRHDASARRSIALFDTGIDQLGAPRIAHLAALIVLAQRADKAHASLEWGVLQDPSTVVRTSVTEATVCELLRGRHGRRVSRDDIERWIASSGVATASELWLVGSEDLVAQAREHRASVLSVSDVLEPGAPQRIKVTAISTQVPRPRTVTLEIPAEPAAVQLLRDPFATAVASRHATSVRIDVNSTIVFSRDGRRLYVRGASRSLLTIQIPRSPRAKVGPPAAFTPPHGHVVAVGQSLQDRRAVVVCRHADEVIVHVLSKRGAAAIRVERHAADGGALPAGTDDIPLRPLGVLKGRHLCFIDAMGQFVEIAGGRIRIKPRSFAVASRTANEAFVYLERRVGSTCVKVARAGQTGESELTELAIDLPLADDTRYYFGAVGLANVIAYSPTQSRCTIVHCLQTATFDVPRTHAVVGMVERGHPNARPFAVAVDGSRTRIVLLHQGETEELLTTAAPITCAAASDAAPVIAFITQSGELGIYSCTAGAMVLRIAAEAIS